MSADSSRKVRVIACLPGLATTLPQAGTHAKGASRPECGRDRPGLPISQSDFPAQPRADLFDALDLTSRRKALVETVAPELADESGPACEPLGEGVLDLAGRRYSERARLRRRVAGHAHESFQRHVARDHVPLVVAPRVAERTLG